jgi:hypothetical protein
MIGRYQLATARGSHSSRGCRNVFGATSSRPRYRAKSHATLAVSLGGVIAPQPLVAGDTVKPVRHQAGRLDDDALTRWWQETGESELRQILHWKWDPIGIAHAFPWAADEYDMYAPQLADSLKDGVNAEQVAEILLLIETHRMALTDSAAAAVTRRKVADSIVEWYENSQERWRQFGPRPR